MSDDQFSKILAYLTLAFLMSIIACFFFWISSCQRTEVLKACFQYGTDIQKSECTKGGF